MNLERLSLAHQLPDFKQMKSTPALMEAILGAVKSVVLGVEAIASYRLNPR